MSPENKESSESYQYELEEAKSAADFLDRVFNEITDSILIIDPQSYRILTFNQGALDNLELDEAQLLEKTCHQLFFQQPIPCETSYRTCPIKEILNNPRHIMTEYEYTSKDNKLKYFEASVSPVKDKDGAIRQIVLLLRNITPRKRAEHRQRSILEVDEITGLYNQVYFYKQLKTEMLRSRRHQRPLSLALVSIDNQSVYRKLSLLNQHEFLAKTGKSISNSIRSVDTVCRYGEYGFGIILPETAGNQAVIFAQRLKQDCHDTLRGSREINKVIIYSMFTLSLGIAEYNAPDEVETLIKKAESALQQARSEGNSVHLWGT